MAKNKSKDAGVEAAQEVVKKASSKQEVITDIVFESRADGKLDKVYLNKDEEVRREVVEEQ